MHTLRVNETTLTSGNAFIVDLFASRGEKESKHDKKTSLGLPEEASQRIWTCLLTLSLWKMHISIFSNILAKYVIAKYAYC